MRHKPMASPTDAIGGNAPMAPLCRSTLLDASPKRHCRPALTPQRPLSLKSITSTLAVCVIAVVSGACASPPAAAVDPNVRLVLEQVQATKFPSRYGFSYQPSNIELLDCLVAPDPELGGAVDADSSRMSLKVRGNTSSIAVTTPTETFLRQSFVTPETRPDAWYRVDSATPPAALTALRGRLGPGLGSFVIPPRLPNDPNSTVLAAADASSVMSFGGTATVNGAEVRRITIVTDPQKVDEQIRQSGGGGASAKSVEKGRASMLDASVDPEGRVVALEVGTAKNAVGTPERDTHEPSYRMTFTSFGTADVDAAPAAALVVPTPFAGPGSPPGTRPGCTVQVGPSGSSQENTR